MERKTLKKCPLCGSKGILRVYPEFKIGVGHTGRNMNYVVCSNTYCKGMTNIVYTEEDARNAWNDRNLLKFKSEVES